VNRRVWLRSAGGLALAAPFLPSLWQRMARGQPVPPPRRSVIFATPNGCLTNRWFPKVEHGALDAAALQGTTLEVLTPFVRKLLVPRGLRAVNSFGRPQTVDPHDQAMAAKLTCALLDPQGNHYAMSHSLDHEIARQVNPGGRGPLVLSVGNFFVNVKTLLSYAAPLTPIIPATNPRTVYASLGGLVTGGSGELEMIRRRRLSVIDAVRDDLQSYQRIDMSGADQRRISVWLDLLRESERGLATSSCSLGAVGADEVTVDAASQSMSNAVGFTAGADMMFKLMALAMLCDTNRSFLFSFPPAVTFKWDGMQHPVDHDGLGHRSGAGITGGTCYPDVLRMLGEIDRWFAGKFATLVSLLDSLPEGSGTLLDNTATTWIQEFSDGNVMNGNNLPIVIAGSAGGYLKQGVAVNVEGGPPIGPGNSEGCCMEGGTGRITFDTGSVGGNVPISKLYVTLLNALGCKAQDGGPVTTFGTLDGVTLGDGILDPGELTALRA